MILFVISSIFVHNNFDYGHMLLLKQYFTRSFNLYLSPIYYHYKTTHIMETQTIITENIVLYF